MSVTVNLRKGALAGLLLLALGALSRPAAAQPFGAWATFNGSNGFVQVPHNAALNPTGAFTFEAWVNMSNAIAGENCKSIAGKNWQQSWWIGICNTGTPLRPTLRSYLKGSASPQTRGIIPTGTWTHVAVVFNGTRRLHYINGEEVLDVPETGPLTTSTDSMRIGSDVQWQFTPTGAIDEVRLWSVARTEAQLRANLNERINTAQPGLVAVWALDGNGNDVVGARDGSTSGAIAFATFPVIFSCGSSSATALCLQSRFLITAKWRTSPVGEPTDGTAQVVPVANPGSGLFWFFGPDNWEVMVKALNGCGLNNRFWIFSAATTNVFYRIEVFDVRGGENKIYFNYPGPPAPAVTDTDAFATCP